MANIVDLFAGAGGLSLGAARAGFDVIAAVEIDSNAMNTHRCNFPNTNHIQADISRLNGAVLLDMLGVEANEIDGIIGGPPCQGFSSIGHGNIHDQRNQLFVKFFELVEDLQPIFFMAENVPGIMNEKYDAIRERAFSHVAHYNMLPPIKVVASEYGAPTSRTRFFFIGYLEDPRINAIELADIEDMKVVERDMTKVGKALEGLPADIVFNRNSDGVMQLEAAYFEGEGRTQSDFFYQRVTGMRPNGVGNHEYIINYEREHWINGCQPTNHSDTVRQRYSRLSYGERDHISKSTKLDPYKFCPTIRAGTGPEKGSYQAVRPIHYQQARVITPREAARLQGFPDWFQLPNTIWHSFRQIGNSVSPIVAERVLLAIHQKLT